MVSDFKVSDATQLISVVLGALATLIIAAMWAYNVYCVLKEFETDRKRGNKDEVVDTEAATSAVDSGGSTTPPMTVRWMITILRTTAITFFLVAALYSLINFAFTKDFTVCAGFAGGILYSYQWAKCILYVIFYVRLYYLFRGTAAADTWVFQPQTIGYQILGVILLTVVITSFQNAVVSDADFFLDNDAFPFFCDFSSAQWVLATMAAADVWMCFTTIFMYKFGVSKLPVDESGKGAAGRALKKLALGYYARIVANAVTTVGGLIVLIAFGLSWVCMIDLVANVAILISFVRFVDVVEEAKKTT